MCAKTTQLKAGKLCLFLSADCQGFRRLVLCFLFVSLLSRKLAELAVVTLAESKYRLGVAVWQGQGGSRPNA